MASKTKGLMSVPITESSSLSQKKRGQQQHYIAKARQLHRQPRRYNMVVKHKKLAIRNLRLSMDAEYVSSIGTRPLQN
jgi:hypothetical protein